MIFVSNFICCCVSFNKSVDFNFLPDMGMLVIRSTSFYSSYLFHGCSIHDEIDESVYGLLDSVLLFRPVTGGGAEGA